jgi:hypothetical protein
MLAPTLNRAACSQAEGQDFRASSARASNFRHAARICSAPFGVTMGICDCRFEEAQDEKAEHNVDRPTPQRHVAYVLPSGQDSEHRRP